MQHSATLTRLFTHQRFAVAVLAMILLLGASFAAQAQKDPHIGGIIEPVTSHLEGRTVIIPNTDQSVDGISQSAVEGLAEIEFALGNTSLLGHTITQVENPNLDMALAMDDILSAAQAGNTSDMEAAAAELRSILLGTTQGRIYDGFAMLNFNRWTHPDIGPAHYPPNSVPGEYKMKVARDSGDTYTSPFDGEQRRIWEIDVSMLYYGGNIDSDTFLLRFPVEAHADDTVRVNYTIYSMVREDFSPTMVILDKRRGANTVQFPFKGFDAVWLAMERGEVLKVSVNYPPVRQFRGVYTWGWRVHPPRIQFMQPIYEQVNAHTGNVELEPQGESYATRNREDLTLDTIADQAPEMKMWKVVEAIRGGTAPAVIENWLMDPAQGPKGTVFEWTGLASEQRQLPLEAWEVLAQEDGLTPGNFGDYDMITVYMNNELYGEGPRENEVRGWGQGDHFKVKLINFDKHTHYFRNVDFGTRLHDDIGTCCGGGQTSFEIMNFKPSYGAPKVAEVQWRAGWGFRPHYNVIQQDGVFSRGSDRVGLTPYTGGFGEIYTGYQYSKEHRRGDFRFNPPKPIVSDENPPFPLRDVDGKDGLLVGQFTEGYGTGQVCPDDPWPGFCSKDIAAFNPNGAKNIDVDGDGTADELHFPPFLRNPAQGQFGAGDIIPPTGAWQPFLHINPNNGTLYIDPDDRSKGHWSDLTFSHGAPVFAGHSILADIELPRASGQVFYQFDDLFHDNAIFSPHPLFEGDDSSDDVRSLRVNKRGDSLRVRGQVSELPEGGYARYVMVYAGTAAVGGCSGRALGNAEVDPGNGRFLFRMAGPEVAAGSPVCVQSTVGGAKSASAQ